MVRDEVFQCLVGFVLQLMLLVDRHVLGDPNEECVHASFDLDSNEVGIQRVFAVNLHALVRQLPILSSPVAGLHIGSGFRLGLGLGHTVPERGSGLPGVALLHGGRVLLLEPDACVFAERRERSVVLGLIRRILHILCHQFRIEVQMQAEAIAGFVVDRRQGGNDCVTAVLAPRLVDGIVLPVHAEIQPLDRNGRNLGLVSLLLLSH